MVNLTASNHAHPSTSTTNLNLPREIAHVMMISFAHLTASSLWVYPIQSISSFMRSHVPSSWLHYPFSIEILREMTCLRRTAGKTDIHPPFI